MQLFLVFARLADQAMAHTFVTKFLSVSYVEPETICMEKRKEDVMHLVNGTVLLLLIFI